MNILLVSFEQLLNIYPYFTEFYYFDYGAVSRTIFLNWYYKWSISERYILQLRRRIKMNMDSMTVDTGLGTLRSREYNTLFHLNLCYVCKARNTAIW